jgi:histidine triad (HIT) family protein
MSDPSCVFCKIVAGQIPCHKVFEDGDTLAFLDVGPLAEGHLLVIPKEHYARMDEMPSELAGRVMAHLPRLSAIVSQVTGKSGFNVLQNNDTVAGQLVPHVHFHIIPRAAGDGLGYRWNATKYPAGAAEEMRDRLLAALQK